MLVSLVGLPGVGKSGLGRVLARRLRSDFLDCDALLEASFGRPIRAVFESDGEEVFRDAESALLGQLVERADAVIATGGGIVLRQANRDLLRRRTRCIYLHIGAETLARRLANDVKRPLLQVPDRLQRLQHLSDERDPLYREVASVVIETEGLSFQSLSRRLGSAASAPASAARA